MDSGAFLRQYMPNPGFGLEIGPSHAPRFPKAAGFNVETVDHASADDLRAKYANAGVDVSKIEEVDYVSDGGPLHQIIRRRGEYDFIYASHVLEHIPNFVGFFQSCETLLKHDGLVILTIPDKRYCFDAFQNASTSGEVLQAHVEQRQRHTPAVAFDFAANMAQLGPHQAWAFDTPGEVTFINEEAKAHAHYAATCHSSEYRDYHGWRFTPSSFRLIMHDLNALKILSTRVLHMAQSDNKIEIYVVLSRRAAQSNVSRLDLMRGVIREQLESNRQLLSDVEPA